MDKDTKCEEVPTKNEKTRITSDTHHGVKREMNEDLVQEVRTGGNDHSTTDGEWTVVAGKKHASKRVTSKKYKREHSSHSN